MCLSLCIFLTCKRGNNRPVFFFFFGRHPCVYYREKLFQVNVWCTTHCIICVCCTTTCNHIAAGWDPLKRYSYGLGKSGGPCTYTLSMGRMRFVDVLALPFLHKGMEEEKRERETAATWSWSIIRRANIPHRISFICTFIQLSSPFFPFSFFLFRSLLIFFDSVWRRKGVIVYTHTRMRGDRASLNVKRISRDVFLWFSRQHLRIYECAWWRSFLHGYRLLESIRIFKFTGSHAVGRIHHNSKWMVRAGEKKKI